MSGVENTPYNNGGRLKITGITLQSEESFTWNFQPRSWSEGHFLRPWNFMKKNYRLQNIAWPCNSRAFVRVLLTNLLILITWSYSFSFFCLIFIHLFFIFIYVFLHAMKKWIRSAPLRPTKPAKNPQQDIFWQIEPTNHTPYLRFQIYNRSHHNYFSATS